MLHAPSLKFVTTKDDVSLMQVTHCGSPSPSSPFFTTVPTNPSFTENLSTEQLLLSVTSRWPHISVTPLAQIFLSTPESLPSTRHISSSVLVLIAQTPPEPDVVKRTPVDPWCTKHTSVTLSCNIKISNCWICHFCFKEAFINKQNLQFFVTVDLRVGARNISTYFIHLGIVETNKPSNWFCTNYLWGRKSFP